MVSWKYSASTSAGSCLSSPSSKSGACPPALPFFALVITNAFSAARCSLPPLAKSATSEWYTRFAPASRCASAQCCLRRRRTTSSVNAAAAGESSGAPLFFANKKSKASQHRASCGAHSFKTSRASFLTLVGHCNATQRGAFSFSTSSRESLEAATAAARTAAATEGNDQSARTSPTSRRRCNCGVGSSTVTSTKERLVASARVADNSALPRPCL
mmetsp:Transcript_1420/g.5923  ORF Transcript_1420/g.5923 Transcript_1420/m.5923 type:complete len:215 (-) Transcript_1420:936-1580(-)